MSFVPFVAVDNHKKSVVVGAALIANEKVPYFTWVLQFFIKAHGTQPKLCITDQCPAMKQAIPVAFPDAKHRQCMWHITNKFNYRVSNTQHIPYCMGIIDASCCFWFLIFIDIFLFSSPDVFHV